jgi:TPR repeat protein
MCSVVLIFWGGCTNKKSNKAKVPWYESKSWRKKAIRRAEQGDVHARCLLDMYHPGWEHREEKSVALPIIERGSRQAAEQGNVEAQFQRGERYLFGYHSDGSFHHTDQGEGIKWLREAAKHGHSEAIELLEMDMKRSETHQPVLR